MTLSSLYYIHVSYVTKLLLHMLEQRTLRYIPYVYHSSISFPIIDSKVMHNTTCIVLLHKIGRICKYPPPNKDERPYYGILCFGNVIPQICECVAYIYSRINTYLWINTYLRTMNGKVIPGIWSYHASLRIVTEIVPRTAEIFITCRTRLTCL